MEKPERKRYRIKEHTNDKFEKIGYINKDIYLINLYLELIKNDLVISSKEELEDLECDLTLLCMRTNDIVNEIRKEQQFKIERERL